MLFKKNNPSVDGTSRLSGFEYLKPDTIYMDAACQSLRPTPVIEALNDYYKTFNACGGRVKYEWGKQVDEVIAGTRRSVLKLLRLSDKDYSVSFTLNTTYGINLILQQLPTGKFQSVVTSDIEHNSVFLPTIALAKRLNVSRLVLSRSPDGTLNYETAQLKNAVVVVNSTSNFDGRNLINLRQLITDTHEVGGIVIIDAAQTAAHQPKLLENCAADAICFSAHKLYAPSLGVIVINSALLDSLSHNFVGGGMVSEVKEQTYTLLPDEPTALLEAGLQSFGEIVAFKAALDWLEKLQKPDNLLEQLSSQLFDGLKNIPSFTIINHGPTTVVSGYAEKYDAHRLAIFLSEAGVMTRSGYFCCHYFLKEKSQLPPLLRFSIGLHSTPSDINTAVLTLKNILGAK